MLYGYCHSTDKAFRGTECGPSRLDHWRSWRGLSPLRWDKLFKPPAGTSPEASMKAHAAWMRGEPGNGPIVTCGGDHSASYGALTAVHATHGPAHVIVFDSHVDAYPLTSAKDTLYGNASMWRLMAEQEHTVRIVGVREPLDPDPDLDVRACFSLKEALEGLDDWPLYVSVDVDVLDPSDAPGTSWRVPGTGMRLETLTDMVAALSTSANFVGGDVVEYNPLMDAPDMLTAFTVDSILGSLGVH